MNITRKNPTKVGSKTSVYRRIPDASFLFSVDST